MMSDAALTSRREHERARGARVEVSAEYAPDDEAQARALLLIMGVPADEIERIVEELMLESPREM
jgi:hypothetical protein